MARWMPAFDAGDLDALAAIMLESAHVLAGAGADVLICPDNSAHIAWVELQAATPLPWLHIATVVGEEARRIGARRVGVLGTRFTMGGPVYPAALGALDIECVVPDAADAEVVDRIIFDELVNGIVDAASRAAYVQVIEHLARRGCDAVALGLHGDPAADQPRRQRPADPRLDPPARPGRGAARRARPRSFFGVLCPLSGHNCCQKRGAVGVTAGST